jgi:FkbM family methyltransferase
VRRLLKQYFNRFLPGAVRSALKRRFHARFNAPVETALLLEDTEGSLRCKIDNYISFLAPLACKDQLVHFTTVPDGRAEFYSIARAARNGGVLFDIGAHSGVISALFCAANPQNRVFSFEPSPVLSERLFQIRELNRFGQRMCIERTGIGEATKTTEMLLDPAGGFIQTQRFDHTMWATPARVQVQIERIADAAVRLNVIPQFIKLDIESYEYEAIKGSPEFLSRFKPAIFLELHLNYLDQRDLPARVVVEMLEQCGYRFYTGGGSRLKLKELYDCPLPSIHVVAR